MLDKLSAWGRWCLFWLFLPNVFVILMWPIGGPPMGRTIIVVGVLATLLSRFRSLALQRMGVLGLLLFSSFQYVLSAFNLESLRSDALLQFLQHARPMESSTYLAAAFALVIAAGLSMRGIAHAPRLSRPAQISLGFAATLLFAGADTLATAATSNSYQRLPTGDLPVRSATMAAGLVQPRADRRNMVIIVVEALGVPVDPDAFRQFRADWQRPEWQRQYNVRLGAVPFFGSTTNAALRELCLAYRDVADFDFAKSNCLPRRYDEAGYQTIGIHAFEGGFFERSTWWPQLGFQQIVFGPELIRQGARQCGGMWPGACDVDIAGLIGQRLKAAKRPQFVYWVTLNSHLPVLDGATPGLGGCTEGTAPLANKSLLECRLFLAHHHLAGAISKLVMDPGLPPTDFLIVGDHMPPFLNRRERLDFDGYNVPWIYLQHSDQPSRRSPQDLQRVAG